MNDNIKDFIQQDRIIDACILYILNAYSNPKKKRKILNSTEINNEESELSVEKNIIEKFKIAITMMINYILKQYTIF